jgi:hypothetical protein
MLFQRFVRHIATVLRHASKSRCSGEDPLRSYEWPIERRNEKQASGQHLAIPARRARNHD